MHAIRGEKILHLAIELRGENFIGSKNKGGLFIPLNDMCHRECFARARDSQQHLAFFALFESIQQGITRGGLVTGEDEIGLYDKIIVLHG